MYQIYKITANPVVDFAAEELKRYLRMMMPRCGEVAISYDPEAKNGGLDFARNESNPLESDVIIIDEMSMVDISLMHALLKAIMVGTRVIFVGDVNQLPSVGAGNVLKDMIDSKVINVVTLNEIFRQARESMIVVNAHRINNGEPLYLNSKGKDFFFIKKDTNALKKEKSTSHSAKTAFYSR